MTRAGGYCSRLRWDKFIARVKVVEESTTMCTMISQDKLNRVGRVGLEEVDDQHQGRS